MSYRFSRTAAASTVAAVFVLSLFAAVGPSCAYSGPLPGRGSLRNQTSAPEEFPRVDVFVARVSETLELTSEQQVEIRPILESHLESMAAIREQAESAFSRTEMQDMRYEVKKLELTTRLKLCRILNAEQMEAFDALLAESMPSNRGPGDGKGGPGGMDGPGNSPGNGPGSPGDLSGRTKGGSGIFPW